MAFVYGSSVADVGTQLVQYMCGDALEYAIV